MSVRIPSTSIVEEATTGFNFPTSNIVTIVLIGLAIVILFVGIYVLFKNKSNKKVESFESEPAPFVTEGSIFSSFPKDATKDSAWNYLTPFGSACVSLPDEQCKKNRQFQCFLDPHNTVYCQWK